MASYYLPAVVVLAILVFYVGGCFQKVVTTKLGEFHGRPARITRRALYFRKGSLGFFIGSFVQTQPLDILPADERAVMLEKIKDRDVLSSVPRGQSIETHGTWRSDETLV